VTFFRSRPQVAEGNPSRFAAVQLLFAHAALSGSGKLFSDQRAAREGFGLAYAREHDTDVRIDDWTLERASDGYRASIGAREFVLALVFTPTQNILLQGSGGYSRKGPRPEQASFYYSWPQLAVSGTVELRGERRAVQGRAWLDHEWSSEALAAEASGWDWTGINGEDGGALMAFRIRERSGKVYWAGGSFRGADGRLAVFQPGDVAFEPLGRWRSPHTGTEYPLPMRVKAGERTLELAPAMLDQEIDARSSTGTVYWEGAVTANTPRGRFGRGFLELTGYWKPLKL
jgi:predicted secreted hydrolase